MYLYALGFCALFFQWDLKKYILFYKKYFFCHDIFELYMILMQKYFHSWNFCRLSAVSV